MSDDWRDFETRPPADQAQDAEWIEVPCRGKIKGNGTVKLFRQRLPPHTVRIVGAGSASVRDIQRIIE